jgi:hypothetical protein
VEVMMFQADCPWCSGPATIESGAERDALVCIDCAIRVEFAVVDKAEIAALAA